MGFKKVLSIVLFFGTMTKGLTHVGQPCKFIKICLGTNVHCDSKGICSCKKDYPVNVGPHMCKKGKHYREQCQYMEECQHFDNNTYCQDLPYSMKTCECKSEFSYSKSSTFCEPVSSTYERPTNLILPTAIGFSLAFAGVLCFCIILWRFCRKQYLSHCNFLSQNTSAVPTSHETNQIEGQNAFLGTDETLPNYDTVITLKSSEEEEEEEECDPPPSYDDVISNTFRTSKV